MAVRLALIGAVIAHRRESDFVLSPLNHWHDRLLQGATRHPIGWRSVNHGRSRWMRLR